MNQPRHSMEESYHIILDSIEEGVFTVNLDWCITSFNRAAEKITGVSRENAIGRSCSEVFSTDVCNKKNCILRRVLDTDIPIMNMLVCMNRSDGKRIPINVNATILSNFSITSGKIIIF
ncbi:MAG: PAS domain S-box protein [Desulfobacteraceae bacterium]|nr:PAS domain S-box protein [Desulfobacteraceae bacterium]